MNTRDNIKMILAQRNAENIKDLVDYRRSLIYKLNEIKAKIAKVEAELAELSPAEPKEGTQIAANDN